MITYNLFTNPVLQRPVESTQYASHEVRAWLLARAMRQSMSGTG